MVKWHVLWTGSVGAVLLAGCPIDTRIDTPRCALTVEAPVVTFDPVAVGVSVPLSVRVSAAFHDCEVTAVRVENLDGTYFQEAEPEGTRSVVTVHVPRDGTAEIPLTYAPATAGFHSARVTLSVPGGTETNPSFMVRGSADIPNYAIYPTLLDFGDVLPEEVASAWLTVDNQSTLDLVVDAIGFSATDGRATTDDLSVGSTFPLTVDGGSGPQAVEVLYNPSRDRKLAANLMVMIGGADAQTVQLIANDCGHGVASAYDKDGDGWTSCGGDCDDRDATVHPNGVEVDDDLDNDCNMLVDDTTPSVDDDGDGYCEEGPCDAVGVLPRDCNDGDPGRNPGVREVCPSGAPVCSDGVDNDCNGVVDGGTEDLDGDGYTAPGGDCDVVDGRVFPGAPERANHLDDDCDGLIDEGTEFYDDDGDGFTETDGDCNDSLDVLGGAYPFTGTAVGPGQPELPDHRDNNCEGTIDEGTFLGDDDGDGYIEGDPDDPTVDDRYRDCDDSNAAIRPSQVEIAGDPLHVDEDCDPSTGP